MFKKFFVALFICGLIILLGNQNETSAADYYVGNFRVSNAKGYIMTETVRKVAETTYEARLKAVFPSGQIQYIYYTFDNGSDNGVVSFRNSDGIYGKVDVYNTPVEYNMWQYICYTR